MLWPVIPQAALAQDTDSGAPPARVGQIARVSGDVSFDGASSGGWAAAAANYPVSNGDSLYTQSGGEAAIALDSSELTLAGNTKLQITQLDANDFAATASQGEVFLSIRDLQQGQSFTVATPRGAVSIAQDGQYDIAAGDTNTPTIVNVFQGAATVTGPGATLNIGAGQAGVLSGTDQTSAQLGQAQPDGFANSLLANNVPPPPSYVPPVVGQMTGVSELAQYGSWDSSPQYGAVWYPQVNSGWAPYRQGHWANVQPWGWTWVESEPWGFAPFHYGRWVQVGPRWGWAPAPAYQGGNYGPSYRPVYAPAVVSFFGVALAAGITAAALSSGSVGWVPLGPEEPYYPSYRSSPDYIRRINVVNVRNIDIVNIHQTSDYDGRFTPDQFRNARGATYIPADAMRRGDPVSNFGRPVDPRMFAAARPIDPGYGTRPSGPQAGFRLPDAGPPLARERPGAAPQPSAFGERHALPPASMSHFAPPPRPNGFAPPQEPANRPAFGMNPAYHAPPPPPAFGEHPGQLPAVQGFHPQEARPELPQVYRPDQPQNFHPQDQQRPAQMPQVYRPEPPQNFHPQDQQRPAQMPQVYHPEQPRPQAEPQMRPQPAEQPRPMMQAPRPEAPRPQPEPQRQAPSQHQDQKPQHPQ